MKKKQFRLRELFWFIAIAAIAIAILNTSITGYRTRTHKLRVAARRAMQHHERELASEQGLAPPVQQEVDERLPPIAFDEIIVFAQIVVFAFFIYFIGKLMFQVVKRPKENH